MRILENIEPKEVWYWFEEISRIPRPSGEEEKIADFLVEFARKRNLEYSRDDVNNVLIRAAGSGRAADNPGLVLQAHVDIVPEKTDESTHDHSVDPIIPVIRGDWVISPDTTLGADNGIGVALMLAVLDSQCAHPPLECLFTTDEERGLTGADNLKPEWINFRRLINLDSEDEGVFTIGGAGGMDIHLSMPVVRSGPVDCYSLEISGLKGGHSGMEIDKNRGNAIRILGRILRKLCMDYNCRIAGVSGGTKRNAIPRNASALIHFPDDDSDPAKEYLNRVSEEIALEYSGIEDGILIRMENESAGIGALDYESGLRIADLLLALPHGVEKNSGVIKGLVETSVNMAIVSMSDEEFNVELTVRSPLASAKKALGERIAAVAGLSGCSFSTGGSYPGWIPDSNSILLKKLIGIYTEISGRKPEVESVHAGLECGIIGERIGNMDMISMGPDIRDVHVPGERASISSLQRFWKFFLFALETLD
ncbi:cytosol nonspecific dipeptidase [Candidatus Fermentibacteria bacterium]|nr:MAG: cytosol nonspecific dipeptidase [Candidatus Fermentibacteria bacterium]